MASRTSRTSVLRGRPPGYTGMSGSIKAHCSSVTSLGYLWLRIPITYGNPPLMGQSLKKEAWDKAGALAVLPEADRKAVEEVAQESAGLFQRSSSCVEGRNGRLSLQHHGQSRVSERRLKALTVIHNYLVRRGDQTTAAERFFGQKHKDVFSWLLERMPNLPRPAQKRRKTASEGLPVAG